MDWSTEFTIHFLECYKDKPCLWDPSNPYYRRKEKIHSAWLRLSEETGKPVSELRRKKDSLMATFRGLLRKKKASIKNGFEGAAVYQPVWFAFSAMESFLGEVYGVNSQDMATPENDNLDIPDFKNEDNENSQSTSPIPSPSPSHHSTSTSFQIAQRRRKYAMELREADKEITEFGAIRKVAPHEEEDECELYGRLLAKKLRKLPEWERQLIMHDIDGLALNAMHRFLGTSSTSHIDRQPPHSTGFTSSHDLPDEEEHTEDLDVDSKADIITLHDQKLLE